MCLVKHDVAKTSPGRYVSSCDVHGFGYFGVGIGIESRDDGGADAACSIPIPIPTPITSLLFILTSRLPPRRGGLHLFVWLTGGCSLEQSFVSPPRQSRNTSPSFSLNIRRGVYLYPRLSLAPDNDRCFLIRERIAIPSPNAVAPPSMAGSQERIRLASTLESPGFFLLYQMVISPS